ncbi:hypothetical protein Tco_0679259 [Tanacetum coccineum]|uniref:Transposase (Putative), gypsy type n=1 Tax=Tanacetum coccineum TaxID=301880 RepID=A0ABQ4XHB3_9ASTR
MSNITDIKYVLTQKGLDTFCHKFHIPECVHPHLPSCNQTMHESPDGKIGLYTRFFDFANFRLPLSTFLVDVLRIEPTVGLFHSLKHWNDHFFWVDSFACPASFPWHAGKSVSKDPPPKLTEFNADHYAALVAHPAPFQMFPESFLCLVGISRYYTLDEDTYPSYHHDDDEEMDLSAFIHVLDPTKVKVVEKERVEGEPKILDSTMRHVVPLLPVSPARSESALDASVEKLFDEGGNVDQVDSAAGGGPDAAVIPVTDVKDIVADDVATKKPKHFRKKRQAPTDAGGSSHPPKILREDHGTSSGVATGGKSPSVIKELLARSILDAEVGVAAVATLPLVTSSVSATPERKDGNPVESITGANLRTIGPSERFVISSDSSNHFSTNVAKAEVDSVIRYAAPFPMMTKAVITASAASALSVLKTAVQATPQFQPSIFHDSSSSGTIKPDASGSSHRPRKELLMVSWEINSESLHESYLNAEVRMRTEYCLSKRRRLETECENQVDMLKARDEEIENLKAQLSLKEAEAAKAVHLPLEGEKDFLNGKVTELQSSVTAMDLELKDFNATVTSLKSQNGSLVDQVHSLETTCFGLRDQVSGYEQLKEQIEEFQDAQINIVSDKMAKLEVDLVEMALHLEERFYPHLLTTISCRRWLLTHGIKLFVVKCLNSPEYLTALGTAISRAIEKGMQDGLLAGIDHRKAGRSLADFVAYNPSVEEDYNSALQELREVNFPLLTDLKYQKDASVEDIMNLLRLEGPLAGAPGMSDLQPDVEQLMLPIHRYEYQVVLGETSLSFALSAAATFDSVSTAVATTTALSTVVVSTSSAPSITIDNYVVIGVDGREDALGDAQRNDAFSPLVDFKKEELDTTP